MSFFKWFAKKPDAPSSLPPDSSGLVQADATQPQTHAARIAAQGKAALDGRSGSRKLERMEQREHLYSVIRDCMNNVGVLSSSYKFKVLSLDPHGRQYLIMMDLPRNQVGDTARLAEVESLIARQAKAQHDILVTSVYWRVNEHVTADMHRTATRPPLVSAAAMATPSVATAPRSPSYEPLQADEMVAFKAAMSAATHKGDAPKAGELLHSGPRNPYAQRFAETQVDDIVQPLSGTQYGELP
jgi:hypothetical protein